MQQQRDPNIQSDKQTCIVATRSNPDFLKTYIFFALLINLTHSIVQQIPMIGKSQVRNNFSKSFDVIGNEDIGR